MHRFARAALCFLAVTGCGGSPPKRPVALSSLSIAPASVTLAVGKTQALSVAGLLDDGSTIAIADGALWISSAEAVATVSAAGFVTAKAPGAAIVSVAARGKTAAAFVTVEGGVPEPSSAGHVFFAGAYAPDVTLSGLPGATNDISIDAATVNPAGHAALKIAYPAGGFTGGAFIASAPRDLRDYDALTLWAKASAPVPLERLGLGDGAAETAGLSVSTSWKKLTVPLPLPGRLAQTRGLVSFRDGTNKGPLTVWLADIQFEKLGTGAPDVQFTSSAKTVAAGLTAPLAARDLKLRWIIGGAPIDLTVADLSYFSFSSDAPSVATVSADGVIAGVAPGTANISARLGVAGSSNALAVTVAPAAYDPGAGWNLVWSDEFDGTAVDSTNWTFDIGSGGWGNNESEYYRAENAVVAGGNLTITAKKETYGDAPYTSARLQTSNKRVFTYGKFSMRAKLPYSQAMWPAFWLLGANSNSFNLYGGTVTWPACGEADIMEMIGGLRDGSGDYTTHGTLHYLNSAGRNPAPSYAYRYPSKLADDFHVYELVWTPHSFTWKMDGLAYGTKIMDADMQAFSKPMFILVNLAVGGAWGGWVDGSTVFPQTYVIDYVRVYTNSSVTAGGPAGLSSYWHLMNGSVSGVSPAGEDLESAKGTVSGFQPLKTLTAPALWYGPTLTGSYEEGAWSVGIFTASPGAASVLKAEVFVVAADGSGPVSLGSAQLDVNTTGAGNHLSRFILTGVPAVHLSNQRLKLVLTPVSGASAQMIYNGNDFDSVLTTPWSPSGP